MRRLGQVVLVMSLIPVLGGVASAQPIGTFRWQQQPYCNVLTVSVVQAGSVFHLDGVDDQCGAATAASVVGLGFLNPSGTIGLGLTVVTTPGGTPLHIDATVSLPSASGTWRDSAGNTGAFVLIPGAAIPGSPRPVPRASFPGGVSVGGTPITNVGAPVAGTDAANKNYVDAAVATKATTTAVRAALLGEKVWKGGVNSNGSRLTTGPYTTSRLGLGLYSFRFNLAGLGIPSLGFPVVAAQPLGGSSVTTSVTGLSISASNGVLTEIGTEVLTFNAAGAAVDSVLLVMISLPDADTGSPVPPLSSLDTDGDVKCTTAGDVTTCVRTFNP